MAAGLVLGPHLVLPMTGLSLAAFGLVLLGQSQGWVHADVSLPLAQIHTLTALGLLSATGVIVYFAAREMDKRASFNEGVIASLPGIVQVFDLGQGRSTWVSRSLTAYLGWEASQLPPDVVSALMHPEDLALSPGRFARWERAKDGEILITPFRMRHASGEWRSFESRDTVHQRDKNGRVTQFVGYIEDVTDKRRVEENLSRAERLQALGQLAGGVAHDFNNVLAPILGNAELIRRGLPDGDERAVAADAIRRSTERARELTKSMLGLSGQTGAARERVDLNEVLASFMPLLLRSMRQDLQVDFAPSAQALPMLADPSQVERALLNLALNAQDALGGQGRLGISTRAEGGFAVLCVDDAGPGMSAAVRARAFEPFFTTKEPGQGTGLGLSSVHAFVLQHGGRVELDSEPDKGAHFRLYFPLLTEGDGALPGQRWPGTVLLVDDEEDLRVVLRRLLESIGWRVLEAGTGDSALAVAAAEPGAIELLISDIRLPGLRGPDLGRQLKALRPGLRSVYISGFTDNSEVDGPLLGKPFNLDQLRRLLDSLKPAA